MSERKILDRDGYELWAGGEMTLPYVFVKLFPGDPEWPKESPTKMAFGIGLGSRWGEPTAFLHFYVPWRRPRPWDVELSTELRVGHERPRFQWRRPRAGAISDE